MFGRARRAKLETLRHLASGGMGEVFLGTLRLDGASERVAIKRPHRHLSRQRPWLRQFEREGEISAALHHPNIVGVRAVGRDRDGPYLALEFVDGWSLRQVLTAAKLAGRTVPLAVAHAIADGAARGLAYAHDFARSGEGARGLIHRDLTPENVLLGRAGEVKLTDFGLARLTGTPVTSTAPPLRGKFGHLAPELFEGKDADVSADLFSLGTLLYELFVQARPFEGRTEAEVIRATLFVDPVPVRERRPEVPPGIDAWIAASLRRNPAERPASVTSLLEPLASVGSVDARAVEVFLAELESGGHLEAARRASTAAVGGPETEAGSRRLAWPLVLAASVAVLGVGASGAWMKFRHAPPESSPSAATTPAAETKTELVEAKSPEPVVPGPAPVPTTKVPAPKRKAVMAHLASKSAAHPLHRQPEREVSPPREVQAAPSASPGTLWIRVSPYAEVYLDGSYVGVTPMPAFRVPAGHHQVLLVNKDLAQHRALPVEIASEQQSVLKVDLNSPQ